MCPCTATIPGVILESPRQLGKGPFQKPWTAVGAMQNKDSVTRCSTPTPLLQATCTVWLWPKTGGVSVCMRLILLSLFCSGNLGLFLRTADGTPSITVVRPCPLVATRGLAAEPGPSYHHLASLGQPCFACVLPPPMFLLAPLPLSSLLAPSPLSTTIVKKNSGDHKVLNFCFLPVIKKTTYSLVPRMISNMLPEAVGILLPDPHG